MNKIGKVGFVIDSSSGFSKEEAEKNNWYFLPLFLTINDKEYLDGENLSIDEYYSKVTVDSEVATAATSPQIIEDVISKASRENDHVIVYTISKFLSKQNDNLKVFTKKYSNVHIVDSYGVTHLIIEDVKQCIKFIEKNPEANIQDVIEYINKLSKNEFAIVIPKYLKWLVKGGRISKTTATMGKLANIVPIIEFTDGKLSKLGKGRSFTKTVIKTARKLIFNNADNSKFIFAFSHANSSEIDNIIDSILKLVDGDIDYVVRKLPSCITNHLGLGAISIGLCKKYIK